MLYKLLMPTISTAQGVMQQIRGQARLKPEETLDKLGDNRLRIVMQARGIDTIGTTDLLKYKFILANQGVDNPGLPATNTFCFEQSWAFEVRKADNPEVIEFISKDYNVHSATRGSTEPKTFESGEAPNWILGTFFKLKGITFESLPGDPITTVGGLESSNMLTLAATAAGSILSGADYNLGKLFCLATQFENDVHGGLTGGQGSAAGILGGAHSIEWAVTLHPYGGVARQLFGPDQYSNFQNHVAFLLPGRDKGGRSSVDINEKWTQDALTPEGTKEQAIFTYSSNEAAAGYANPGGIDWIRVATAAQQQSDIRVRSCPAFFAGIEDIANRLLVKEGNKVLRAVTRPGAGGYGTPVIVYSATQELADGAKRIIGERLEVAAELADEIRRSGIVPRGWIDFRLSPQPIQFIGVEEAGFNKPGSLVEVVI